MLRVSGKIVSNFWRKTPLMSSSFGHSKIVCVIVWDDGRQTPDPEGLPGRRVISDPRIPTRPSPARLGLFNTSRYEARRPLGRGRGHAGEPPPDHSHATFLIFTFTLATAGDGRPRRAAPHRALRPIFLGERVRENRPSEGGLGTAAPVNLPQGSYSRTLRPRAWRSRMISAPGTPLFILGAAASNARLSSWLSHSTKSVPVNSPVKRALRRKTFLTR